MKHILSHTLLIAFILTGCIGAYAQSDSFKAEWKQAQGPLYFTLSSLPTKAKLPTGQTTFKVFGFNGKVEIPADFSISGNIEMAYDMDKQWRVTMNDAKFSVKNEKDEITFEGALRFIADKNKNTSAENIFITFIDGTLDVNGDSHRIRANWSENVGTLMVAFDEKYRPGSQAEIDMQKLYLPKKSYRPGEPSVKVLNGISDGSIRLNDADHAFLQQVFDANSTIMELPEYQEYISVVTNPMNDKDTIDVEVIGHQLGNIIKFDDLTAERDGKDIKLSTKYGRNGWEASCTAIYNTYERNPQFSNIKWDNGASYELENETLTRTDGSKLYAIYFDYKQKDKYINQRGYIPHLLKALQEVINENNYEFGDVCDKYGLVINSYSDPNSNNRVALRDNVIVPIAERKYEQEAAERLKQAESDKREQLNQAEYGLQQEALAKEYRGDSAPIALFTQKTTSSNKHTNIQVKKYIRRLPDGQYQANYKVNSKGLEYDLEYNEELDDFCFNTNDVGLVTITIPEKYRAELERWYRLSKMK